MCRFSGEGFLYAFLIILGLVVIKSFNPTLGGNESVYLIPSRQLVDPNFLQQDWTMGRGYTLSLVFSSLIAPLWLIFDDFIAIALCSRLIVWALLIFALIGFARELQVRWYALTLGVFFFLFTGRQGLMAGEWIFGGAEQKSVAYALLLLSITYVLRKRTAVAGILCGLSVSLHILVGGWGAIAIAAGLILCRRYFKYRETILFLLCAGAFSLPMAIIGLEYIQQGRSVIGSGQPLDINALHVLYRNPHHLDPNYFLNWVTGAKLGLYSAFTLFALRSFNPGIKRSFLISLLGVLVAIVVAGIAARQAGMLWFLKYYPFRLADVLLPLLFWVLVARLVVERKNIVFDIAGRGEFTGISLQVSVVLLAFIVTAGGLVHAVPRLVKEGQKFVVSWSDIPKEEKRSRYKISLWIRENIPAGAIIIVHPCKSKFWVHAERAMVVNFKSAPSNPRMIEWYRRILALNGGKTLQSRGFEICKEITNNYRALKREQLRVIVSRYNADYYLVKRRRDDLSSVLVKQKDKYYLYDLGILAEQETRQRL